MPGHGMPYLGGPTCERQEKAHWKWEQDENEAQRTENCVWEWSTSKGEELNHSRLAWEWLLADGLVSNASLIREAINNTTNTVPFWGSHRLLTAYHYNPIRTRYRSREKKDIGYNSWWGNRKNQETYTATKWYTVPDTLNGGMEGSIYQTQIMASVVGLFWQETET